MIRLQCAKYLSYLRSVPDFDLEWDPVAGTLTGQGAEYIKHLIDLDGCVDLHPFPRGAHEFSADPLKSYVDMACIIGLDHSLPDVLVPYYPYIEEEDGDDVDEDEDGNVYAVVDGKRVIVGQRVY